MTGIVAVLAGQTVAAAPAATVSTTSFSNVSWNWSQFYVYQLAYAGLDSSSRPVFAFGYKNATSTYPNFTLFRVNSDLTITQGSANQITAVAVSDGVVATVDTDNNYGYCMYHKSAGGAYAKTFTIDKDNLSIGTPGSEATIYATSDAGIVSADYAGGGRVHYFHRRGGQFSGNFYSTRSGTTLTIGTEILGNVGASVVYTQLRTSDASGSLYRHIIISGNGAPQASAMYWNNTSGSTASTASAISWGTGSGIRPHSLVRLKSADKFMIVTSGATAAQMASVTVTWPASGTTAPTLSTGTALSFTDTPATNMYGAIDGFSNDEAYIIYKKSSDSKFYWRKITASSNTLTEGSANEVAILSSNAANAFACRGVQAFSKKYIVGVVDNSTSTAPDIFVTEVT
jgi:hypothetical protein